MSDFASPLGGLAEGIQGGVNMGLQIDQAQQARKAQDWENDYRMMSTGLTLAKTKGMSPESQAKILNQSVAPVWKKWTGQDFPQIDANNVDAFAPVVNNIHDLGTQAAAGKIPWQAAFAEANNQVANFHVKNQLDTEQMSNQQKAEEAAMAPIKGGYESEKKVREKDAKTPDEVMKEMFDVNKSVVGMQQLDQQTANMIQMNPEAAKGLIGSRLTPAQLAQVKGVAAARMQTLNALLPADRRLQEITPQQAEILINGGKVTMPDGSVHVVTPHSQEEVFRKNFVVPGK